MSNSQEGEIIINIVPDLNDKSEEHSGEKSVKNTQNKSDEELREENLITQNSRNEVMNNYQKQYSELSRLNFLIQRKYRCCICWTEFCLVSNVIFTITFAIFFLNPKDHSYDSVFFLGVSIFFLNSICFGYGLASIHKRSAANTMRFTRLLSIDVCMDIFLLGWLCWIKQQVGILFAIFVLIETVICLLAIRGLADKFKRRFELYLDLKAIAETNDLNLDIIP
jgi:hypothetical protein